jgi:hypothetical protein
MTAPLTPPTLAQVLRQVAGCICHTAEDTERHLMKRADELDRDAALEALIGKPQT